MIRPRRSQGRDLGCEKLEVQRLFCVWTETEISEEIALPNGDVASGISFAEEGCPLWRGRCLVCGVSQGAL